jgi:IS5 family transposase
VIEQGNPGDVTVAVRQLARQKKLFGKAPRTAVFDGGYVSRENFDQAKTLGTTRTVFSKTRGCLTPEQMAGNRRTYGRLRHFRAGVEGVISFLKRSFGLDRCTWKGARRFAAYVWSAIVAANLTTLARARLCAG